MSVRWITADVFDGLAQLEDASVDLVVTSPPFLALRSYLPADHPDKAKEIGSEATPAAFIDVMLAVTAELRRVLAPHGSIAIELGDTYAGGGGENHLYEGSNPERGFNGSKDFGTLPAPKRAKQGWPLAKSKALIPELYRIALAYGINPLTGAESPAGRWRVRNVVTWCRPNPPVGALADKWRPATSDIVVACTSDKRYWDDVATRRPVDAQSPRWTNGPKSNNAAREVQSKWEVRVDSNPAGAPLLDWWEIPPGGYPGSHYAVYPPALIEPLIKAMAPPKVCRTCGEPSRRITETSYVRPQDGEPLTEMDGWRTGRGGVEKGLSNGKTPARSINETLGWTDCGHDDWRPAVVLDCFGGSGTTGAVATGYGHDAVLIDLDDRNVELARDRIGPMLFDGPHYVTSRDGARSDDPPLVFERSR